MDKPRRTNDTTCTCGECDYACEIDELEPLCESDLLEIVKTMKPGSVMPGICPKCGSVVGLTLSNERNYQPTCEDCGGPMPLQVCKSMAGYYVGHWCENCGPYARMSGYFNKREDAERELASIKRSEEL